MKNIAKIKYSGNIGFNVVPNQNIFHFESGLVFQMKSKNVTQNYLFTLSFNDNDFNGYIIIGKNIIMFMKIILQKISQVIIV